MTSSSSSSSSIFLQALTSNTTGMHTTTSEAVARESVPPWNLNNDNACSAEPDPFMIMVALVALATCLGGAFAIVYHIKKHVNNNSNSNRTTTTTTNKNSCNSKAVGMQPACWYHAVPQKGRKLMMMASRPAWITMPWDWKQQSQQQQQPMVGKGPCWMYSLLDETSPEVNSFPVYRPLTIPVESSMMLNPEQQQQHQV